MISFRKPLFSFAALLMVGIGASSCSCDGPETTEQTSRFESTMVEDPTGEADYLVDFEVTAVGGLKRIRGAVKNTGNKELTIWSPRVEGPFSLDIPSTGRTIGVGAAGDIIFSFEPMEETAEPLQAIATLNTNERGGPTRTVRLVGHGKKARLDCAPERLDFGVVPLSSSRSISVVCTNALGVELEVRTDRFRGNHADFFTAHFHHEQDGFVTVPPHGSLSVDVTFQSESVGINEATLELRDASNNSLTELPAIANSVNSTVVFEPKSCLDFSYVDVNESEKLPMLVRTIGDHSMKVTKLSVAEENRSHFSILTAAPLTLTPGADPLEIMIEFHPMSDGPHQTHIELQADDPHSGVSFVQACARGFGGGPAISCHPTVMDFGEVAVGMPVRRQVECVNSGRPVPGMTIDPLVISDVRTTADEFTAKIFDPDTGREGAKRGGYQVGERFGVEVVYAPAGELFDSAVVEMETTAARGGTYEIRVSGQGRGLPPCGFTVEPPRLRFGIVDRGAEATREFAVRNNLDTPCLINDLRITGDADGVFSMAPIANRELMGNETLRVPVTFAPIAYRDQYTARVEFQISNPIDPNQRIELLGSSSRPCISIEPELLDFGKVGPGCASREVSLTVSNTCASPVEVLALDVSDALDSEAFIVRTGPSLPRSLLPHERENFTMVFSPDEIGAYSGSVEVEVEGLGSYFSAMIGEAAQKPIQTDTFEQKGDLKVDVLWVMDHLFSLSDHLKVVLAQHLPAFLSSAIQQNLDINLAVITSEISPPDNTSCPQGVTCGGDGRFVPIDGSHPRILTRVTPDLEAHWAHNIGTNNDFYVRGFAAPVEAAFRALSEPLISETKSSKHDTPYNDGNAGFLRREASLSIIFVSDELEMSTHYGMSIQDYLNFFRRLKGRDMLRIHGIVGGTPSLPTACGINRADRYHTLIDGTGGTWLDICTPASEHEAWERELTSLSEGAFGFFSRFVLRGTPGDRTGDLQVTAEDIELEVNGEPFPPVGPTGARRWSYNPLTNAIDFDPRHVPRSGARISATYEVACSNL